MQPHPLTMAQHSLVVDDGTLAFIRSEAAEDLLRSDLAVEESL